MEEWLADEADLGLDQLARWSGVPFDRVHKWSTLELEVTEEETVRLRAVVTLYLALFEQLTWLGEVFEERFGKPGKNGSGK